MRVSSTIRTLVVEFINVLRHANVNLNRGVSARSASVILRNTRDSEPALRRELPEQQNLRRRNQERKCLSFPSGQTAMRNPRNRGGECFSFQRTGECAAG